MTKDAAYAALPDNATWSCSFGNPGETIIVKIGFSDDPYVDPTYTTATWTIGVSLQIDVFVSGRYMAIRFETGTAYQWRLDSYDWLDVIRQGRY